MLVLYILRAFQLGRRNLLFCNESCGRTRLQSWNRHRIRQQFSYFFEKVLRASSGLISLQERPSQISPILFRRRRGWQFLHPYQTYHVYGTCAAPTPLASNGQLNQLAHPSRIFPFWSRRRMGTRFLRLCQICRALIFLLEISLRLLREFCVDITTWHHTHSQYSNLHRNCLNGLSLLLQILEEDPIHLFCTNACHHIS